MDVLGDLVDPDRGGESLWIHRPGSRSRSWSGRQFCVDAWKAGNLFRHYGVHEGATVSVADATTDSDPTPSPQALVGLFGAWVLGASVRTDPSESPPGRVFLVPADAVDRFDLRPETTALGYGSEPADPTVVHFEEQRWSENPVKFPAEVDADATALHTDAESFSHGQLLAAGRQVVADYDLGSVDRVALAASLADPGAVVAGVIAPLLSGTTITLGGEASLTVGNREGENVIRPAAARP
jgi:hypothetical protein